MDLYASLLRNKSQNFAVNIFEVTTFSTKHIFDEASMLNAPVNSYVHAETLPPFHGTFTQLGYRFICYVIQRNFISTGLDCQGIDTSNNIWLYM